MSNPGISNNTPIETRDQLVECISSGSKPSTDWRIGTEHEKFTFKLPASSLDRPDFSSAPYAPNGIESLLKSIEGTNWDPIYDPGTENIIGLTDGKQSISLEPAGQFELSGAPLENINQTKKEMDDHFNLVSPIAEALGYGFSPLGFQPLWKQDQMPWMPKKRYVIMKSYMPKVGSCGLDMMTRTCTVQVNLDFSSEKDMSDKMAISLALQPLITALFANSPFIDGKPNGWLSNRGRIWLDTDKARSGQPKGFLEEGLTFEKYVDWALEVPMYFVLRDNVYHDVAGASFKDWMNGTAEGVLATMRPTIGDFEDHLTTLFPDVRLKTFLEMRGADAGSPEMMLAFSAFWTGLFYSKTSLEECLKLVKKQDPTVYRELRETAPKLGLKAPFPLHLRAFAKQILMLSSAGLRTRGLGEEQYLAPLEQVIQTGETQADYWLKRYNDNWNGDVTKIFMESRV